MHNVQFQRNLDSGHDRCSKSLNRLYCLNWPGVERKMIELSFSHFFMPAVHNQLESAKYHADRQDYKTVCLCLDGALKALADARAYAEKELSAMDRGVVSEPVCASGRSMR